MRDRVASLTEYDVPSSAKVEQQLLADVASNPETIGDIASVVNESMFTNEARVFIWRTILWMRDQRIAVDLVSLSTRCGKCFQDEIIQSGAISRLSTSFEAISHAALLRDTYARRRTYDTAIQLLSVASNPVATETEVYSEADKLNRELRQESSGGGLSTMAEVVERVGQEIDERIIAEENGGRTRIPTSFYSLDVATLGGWGAGQLIILAARPSVGKTAIMLQMAKESARNGFPSMIFSLEMTETELGRRLIASTGKISQSSMLLGGRNDLYSFEAAANEICNLPILIDDRSRFISDIIAKIILASEQGKCKAAFIDYLGLIKDRDGSKLPLYQQIANITSDLKNVAKRAQIPVILLCQLSRDSAKDGRAPQLYDLRDSGSIEQDADIVLMLDQQNTIDSETPDIDMWIRKNRQNTRGNKITLHPENSYTSFIEV